MGEVHVRAASEKEVPLILAFIKELAEYERLSHEVVATEESLREHLFGERPVAEVIVAEEGQIPPVSPFSSTASRPSWADPVSTSKTST
jgi:hypothetical protein